MFAELTTTVSEHLRNVCVIDKSCTAPLIAVVRHDGLDVGAVFLSPANDGEMHACCGNLLRDKPTFTRVT